MTLTAYKVYLLSFAATAMCPQADESTLLCDPNDILTIEEGPAALALGVCHGLAAARDGSVGDNNPAARIAKAEHFATDLRPYIEAGRPSASSSGTGSYQGTGDGAGSYSTEPGSKDDSQTTAFQEERRS